jgi:hypothetical protein
MARSISLTFCLGLVACTCGCEGVRDVFHPGDEKTQVVRSQIYDPYPDPDLGPPIVGGRPPDYVSPRAEVLRVQPRLGEPLVGPGQAPTANNVCPPGYGPANAPTYGPTYPGAAYPGVNYGNYAGTTAVPPPAGNMAPAYTPLPPEQSGNVIYAPPPAVDASSSSTP